MAVPDKAPASRMSVLDSARFLLGVALPTWAKGIIIRRPFMVALAERFGMDERAVHRMAALRQRYGGRPVLIRNPIRPQLLLLSGGDVSRVLEETPDPFSPASSEKRAALSHFEPHGSLVTRGPDRIPRRAFSDEALQSEHPAHSLGEVFAHVVAQECRFLLRKAEDLGELDWPMFAPTWFRIVRRVVLGSAAAGDIELTRTLARLRARANWAFLVPKRRAMRQQLHATLGTYLARAEPGSLAAQIAGMRIAPEARPTDQVAQWLFAFDPAGMTAFRALGLLAVHPDKLERARNEIDARGDWTGLAFLRAVIVETLRLFPTTPMILRQTTRPVSLGGALPVRTGVAIFTPFFHRDPKLGKGADCFEPEFWLNKDPAGAPPLLPFSAGPAACPARHLVPMLASMALAAMLGEHELAPVQPAWLRPGHPLKGTLDNFAMRFQVRKRNGSDDPMPGGTAGHPHMAV